MCYVLSKLETITYCNIMIPIATLAAKSLGKRIGKVTTEAQEKAGEASKYLMELFKNHKLIKIFQKENFETQRSRKIS